MSQADAERRHNRQLREVLDELVEHVRYVSRNVHQLARQDLAYAEERLEWLAEEVWRVALEGEEHRTP